MPSFWVLYVRQSMRKNDFGYNDDISNRMPAMNLATDCLTNVAALDGTMAPLVAQKKAEFAKLHTVLNARLEQWCELFDEYPGPDFDGKRGFGFRGRFKENIFADELLVKLVVNEGVVEATFDPDVFEDNIFTMRLPLRYLDAETGEAAMLQDINDYKAQYASEHVALASSTPSP